MEQSNAFLPNNSAFKEFEVQVLQKIIGLSFNLQAYIEFLKCAAENCDPVFNELFKAEENLKRAVSREEFKKWLKSKKTKHNVNSIFLWAKRFI